VITVLGIDTGFAALGWAKLVVRTTTWAAPARTVIDCGVIATERSAAAARSTEDDVRRLDELARALVLLGDRVDLIAYELPAGAQGARAALTLGAAHGLIRGVFLDVREGAPPLMYVTPRQVKVALAENEHADKPAMIAAAERWRPQVRNIPRALQEHAADAIGVTLAAVEKRRGV